MSNFLMGDIFLQMRVKKWGKRIAKFTYEHKYRPTEETVPTSQAIPRAQPAARLPRTWDNAMARDNIRGLLEKRSGPLLSTATTDKVFQSPTEKKECGWF
jgi:hypothetical protein